MNSRQNAYAFKGHFILYILAVLNIFYSLVLFQDKFEYSHISPDDIFLEDYQLASSQSHDFFKDTRNADWKLLQEIARSNRPHLYPNNPLKYTSEERRGKTPAWYQTNYEPDFSCQFEQRIGGNGNGDGPKWVCDPHRITLKQCLVYSIGSNGDFQFEVGIASLKKDCEIHIFDFDDYEKEMNQAMLLYNVTNLHFHQWGLSHDSKTEDGHVYKSLKQSMEDLGHSSRHKIDIFKIDCEGCEWETVDDWMDPSLPRLQQILVEIHRSPPTHVLHFFNTLRQHGYAIFHKEPNIQHSQGNCLEYGFLKLSPMFFGTSNRVTPAHKKNRKEI
jgi:hypothetical protein